MPSAVDQPRSDANFSALDIAIEDEASGLGLPFLPDPPPPPLRGPSLLGVAVLDRNLRFRRVDSALAEANGLTVEDHLGRTLQEAAPKLATVVEPVFRRVVETGEPVLSLPIRGTARPAPEGRRWLGSVFPLPPSPEAIQRGRNRPAGVVAVVREVDEELTLRPRGVSDERFRELVTRATVGLAQVDRRGTYLYVNDRYCEMTGWNREELVGVRRQQDITHPNDAGHNDAKFARALRTGEPYLHDKRLRRPDGRSVWVRNTVTLLPGADGEIESLFTVAVDLTDRVRTQRALSRSENRLRLAAEAGGIGMWAFDLKHGTADWSPEALEIYGGGFDGRPTVDELLERVHPDDRDLLDETEPRPAGDGPARVDVTHRVVHPPAEGRERGEVRWVRALGERWLDEAGRPLRSTGVVRDVTAEHLAAGQLADSERRLRMALDAADVGVFDYDVTTGVAEWDARTRRFFGVDGPEYGGRSKFRVGADGGERMALTHPEDRRYVQVAMDACMDPAGDGRYDVTHRVVHPDGTIRWVHVRGETRFEGDGADRRPVQTSGTVRDVTAERERERRLAEVEERRRLAAEAADLGAFDFDPNTGRLWWDERSRAIFNPAAPEIVDVEDVFACIHPDDVDRVRADIAAVCAPGGSLRYQMEYRVVSPDGEVRWVRANGEGRFETPGEAADRLVGCVRDITVDREREERLRLSEERQRLSAAAAELGSFIYKRGTGEVWWDARCGELFDVPGETVSIDVVMNRIHPDDRAKVERQMTEAADRTGPSRFRTEYRVVRPDGSHRWIRSHAEAQFADADGPDDPAIRLIGYLQDVTAEKRDAAALEEARTRLEQSNERLEREVARRTAQLRTAAERLQEVGRQERDRIAHVLHDHLQQILVGAKMNLSVLKETTGGDNRDMVDHVSGLLDEAIDESRSLSAELAPPILRTAGLGPALSWLAEQFRARHTLNVTVDWDAVASDALDASLAALLFGAARESLLNAAKHAEADVVHIALKRGACGPGCGGGACPSAALLTVVDDGRGFTIPPADKHAAAGFGMSDLRQQVDLLGGELVVVSAPGAGCTVTVCVPLPATDAQSSGPKSGDAAGYASHI